MKTKLLAMSLITALSLTLVGCSQANSEDKSTNKSQDKPSSSESLILSTTDEKAASDSLKSYLGGSVDTPKISDANDYSHPEDKAAFDNLTDEQYNQTGWLTSKCSSGVESLGSGQVKTDNGLEPPSVFVENVPLHFEYTDSSKRHIRLDKPIIWNVTETCKDNTTIQHTGKITGAKVATIKSDANIATSKKKPYFIWVTEEQN